MPGPQDARDGQDVTGLQVTYGGAAGVSADVGGVSVRDNEPDAGDHVGDGVEEAVGEGGVGGVPDTVGRGIEDQPDGAADTPGFFGMCGGNGMDDQVTDLDRRFPVAVSG